ncbi:MAG: hypothetical protein IJY47_02600 [Clostridia bacterium]|nr:hypothetical protein [Clostridia bacterium]
MKRIIAVFVVTVILLCCLASCGLFVKEAERAEERNFIIDGEKYIGTSIGYTEQGRRIAKADSFDIMEIPEDKDHNFLVVRSFLDDWTIVRESYVIPTEGGVSVAYLGRERVADGVKWNMVQSILNQDFQGEFTIAAEVQNKHENEFTTNVMNAVKSIKVGYEDCPVGTDWIGSFGNINGKLVFIKN